MIARGHEITEGFIPISVATLVPDGHVGIGLYIRDSFNTAMRLYCAPDVAFTPSDLQKLLDRGHSQLFVRADEHGTYQQYLRDNLAAVLNDESLRIERRFALLNEVVRDVLASAFGSVHLEVNETIAQCRELARYTVDLICRDDAVAEALLGVMKHDYHTFTHSANVSYYCLLLARAWGISDRVELNKIAVGALLHDLGKLAIDPSILCKRGRLDDVEFEAIRTHPTRGFQQLCHRDDLNYGQMMMVYQHHERLDGRGYPVGLVADDLHPWAKLCSVVDVFEALTSNRPYRSARPRAVAVQIMDRDDGLAFDTEILKCWKQIIKPS